MPEEEPLPPDDDEDDDDEEEDDDVEPELPELLPCPGCGGERCTHSPAGP